MQEILKMAKHFRQAALRARELCTDKQKLVFETTNTSDLVDIAYLAKKAGEYADEARKACNRLSDLAQKIAGANEIQEAVKDDRGINTLKGEYATATVKHRQIIKYPRKIGEPGYEALMEHLGIPKEAWGYDLVRPNFNGITDYVDLLTQEGKDTEVFGEATHQEFKLSMRSRREL